jgi:hypothetical protein
MASLVARINSYTGSTYVTAADDGGRLNLSATANGVKITLTNDSTGGNLGWTAEDRTDIDITTAASDGVDIIIDKSQISTGDIGWTSEDIASKELYGATLALTVTTLLDGVEQPQYSKTFTNNILARAGTITNFSDAGVYRRA